MRTQLMFNINKPKKIRRDKIFEFKDYKNIAM